MPDTVPRPATPTPFMAQYLEIKAAHRDALLFFRMGDFYELFFEDAVDAAALLDITLTSRGEHDGQPIPMAGVPCHAADAYLSRLIRSGRRVAVCEQIESPAEARKRGSKAVVGRRVVRVITPGTLTEETLLPHRQRQGLAAVTFGLGSADAAVAVCDVSTGAFDLTAVPPAMLSDVLTGFPLSEIIYASADRERPEIQRLLALKPAPLTERPGKAPPPRAGEAQLRELYELAALDSLGTFTAAELSAAGLLLDYVRLTQAGDRPRLGLPRRPDTGGVLLIDAATRASLEIDRQPGPAGSMSLLAVIDRTLTGPGARKLAADLARPSRDSAEIQSRHDAVAFLVAGPEILAEVRRHLKSAPDIERARMRLALGRGGPRDLAAIGRGLSACEAVAAALQRDGLGLPDRLAGAAETLGLIGEPRLQALKADLSRALSTTLPVLAREGGFVASGWDAALDEVRALRDDARRVIADLQARYSGETGLSGLKIKFNNILGYFVELPARQAEALLQPPHAARFIHRQTMAGAVRFTTAELAELAGRIARAEDEAIAREMDIFDGFALRVRDCGPGLECVAGALASLDVSASHASWAVDAGAVRPLIVSQPVFIAEGLRHPTVEAALRLEGQGFTPNDLSLDASGQAGPRLLLVTGPNMAGKSTYLRQAALAVVLAQAGAFVPARALTLGLVDRLFSRVGASDDLARGRSTFMVEMIETATILNQATPSSFVILDEVGRGTATWDGLAIAWAAVEHLHDTNRARAIFATHYHELTSLADSLPHAANASLKAREWKGSLVFLHEIQPGPADKSYGVQVARLAGLPRAAVARAAQILKQLEAGPAAPESLPLFAAATEPAPAAQPDPVVEAILGLLTTVEPDSLSPREALDLLYRLKALTKPPP